MPDEDTEQLFVAARAGDRDAVEQLSARCLAWAHAHIESRRRGAPLDVDDICQDVLARMLQGLDSFEWRGSLSFRSWVRTIASNRMADLAQSAGCAGRACSNVGAFDELESRTRTPSSLAMRRELRRALFRAIRVLPPDQRRAFWLARMEGLSAVEVQEKMELASAGYARVLVSRATAQIGATLMRS